MRPRFLGLLVLLAALGCGGPSYKLVPVSGRVTLNGKPLAKAWVHFAPMATKGNIAPGPTSHGQTDAQGKYSLRVDTQRSGAVVGPSRVFITTLEESTEDLPDAGMKKAFKDLVPTRYNQNTQLQLEVPSGGTDKANFDLTAP